MGKKWQPPENRPRPARPFIVATFDSPENYLSIKKELTQILGHCDYESPLLSPFGLKSLYDGSQRRNLRLLSFERLVNREELVDIRKRTLSIESSHQQEGRLEMELDPGYLTEFTIVRSALEDDFHHIYLFHGIYAETLYHFEKFSYIPTAPLPGYFKEKELITFFNDLRLLYLTVLENE